MTPGSHGLAHRHRGVLSVRGLSKAYATPVLDAIDLDLDGGQVHALLGANGAGKSTLVRIVCGLTRPDAGTMSFQGRTYAPSTRRAAEDAGVRVVLQELNLIPTLSVAENLFLARLPTRFGVIDRQRLHAQARDALDLVGLADLAPQTPVSALGIGQRQLVEIAAALAGDCRLLILDEPTAALTGHESERLFTHVRRLRDTGIAVLYITHRLEEIARIADRVTVLRDGRVRMSCEADGVDREALVAAMTAEASPSTDSTPEVPRARRTVDMALRVQGLRCGRAVRDVSFDVRRGEIVGLSGLVGAGRTETLRAIFGADRRDAGEVRVHGGALIPSGNPAVAVAGGIGMVPEDRQRDALLPAMSLRANTSLAALTSLATARTWIDRTREQAAVVDLMTRFGIRARNEVEPVGHLSGGNQQKVVLARWLLRQCVVLLIDEPTRGIDVAAKRAVHALLTDLAAQGTAIVVVSSEVEELMAICDRIVVLAAGRVTATFERPAFSEAALLDAAFAGSVDRHAPARPA